MTTKINQKEIRVKVRNKTFTVLVSKTKDALMFSDIEEGKVGRTIIFHKAKERNITIGIEIINRREYENKNKKLNLYTMAKEQVGIFNKWVKQ